MKYRESIIKSVLIVSVLFALLAPTMRGEDSSGPTQDLARIKSEYADVLALQGTAKEEVLAIARILRTKPEMAIDRTAAAGEFCLKSSSGTMVHFASNAAKTKEGIVYEFDASELIKAGLNPERLAKMPSLGEMEPGRWYLLPRGMVDPHHNHAMPAATIAVAADVR